MQRQTKPNSVLLRLPYPPTVNHYYRRDEMGRPRLTKQARIYRTVEVPAAILEQCGHVHTMTGRLSFSAFVTCPDRRERDLDNVKKALWDALQHNNVFVRDSQIDEEHVKRLEPSPPGNVLVILVEYAQELPWTSQSKGRRS